MYIQYQQNNNNRKQNTKRNGVQIQTETENEPS